MAGVAAVTELKNKAKLGRGTLGIVDPSISRDHAIISVKRDGSTHVAAGGKNALAVIHATGEISMLRKKNKALRLLAGDTLEMDGFKRASNVQTDPGLAFRVVEYESPSDNGTTVVWGL